MRSNLNLIYLATLFIFLSTGCEGPGFKPEENIIGEPLDVISSFSDSDNTSMINMFDETTRRIHTFDLQTMAMVKSTEVKNPFDPHYVIASDDESFFVDLSAGNLSLYNYDGGKDENFISFYGDPVSSAYNRSSRTLVVYDDLNSVAMVKISQRGEVEKSWVGGPLITGENSIQAGEVLESGDLVLSLVNGSFAIVDIEASINSKQWVYNLDSAVPHTNVKWIADAGNSQVLYQNEDLLVLYDLATSTVVDSKDLPDKNITMTYSKSKNPHVIYRGGNYYEKTFSLAYVQGAEIVVKSFVNLRKGRKFHQSRLDLDRDLWSYIGSGTEDSNGLRADGFLIAEENRHMVTHRVSDMLVVNNDVLPEDAYLKRSKDYVFALYPSELGYAEKIDVRNSSVEKVRNFNVKYITPELDNRRKEKEELDPFFP